MVSGIVSLMKWLGNCGTGLFILVNPKSTIIGSVY